MCKHVLCMCESAMVYCAYTHAEPEIMVRHLPFSDYCLNTFRRFLYRTIEYV